MSQNKMLKVKFPPFSLQYEKTEKVMDMKSFGSGPVRKAQKACLSAILQHGQDTGQESLAI